MPRQTGLARTPGATRARSGYRLRLDVQPRDGVHPGGDEPFYLLLPVTPARTT
jgi:hypothetical protein